MATTRTICLTLAATLLSAGLLLGAAAHAAEAPIKGAHHFALLKDLKPIPSPRGEHDLLDLSGNNTENRYTLEDEHWDPGFRVPRHYHQRHAEIFYVISGALSWTLGDETHVLHAGDLAYIPPYTAHATHVVGDEQVHLLFISTPGGFEFQQFIPSQFSEEELGTPAAKALMAALADFNPLAPNATGPQSSGIGPERDAPHFGLKDNTRTAFNPSGNVTSRIVLPGDASEGRFTIQDEDWPADFNVKLHYHKRHAEVFYILGGAVEWTVGGETHVMHAGDLVYIPPNTPHKVHVVGGKPAHIFFLQSPGGYEAAIDLRNQFSEEERSAPAAKAALAVLHDFHPIEDPRPYTPAAK